MTHDRLLLIGGSTANGLGLREVPFGHRYRNPSGAAPEVLDLTASGRLLTELDGDRAKIRQFDPDLAVICAGMSERLAHPARWFQDLLERFAPRGWHGVAGLEPRAYVSRAPRKRLRQRLIGRMKVNVKRMAMLLGHSHRMPLGEVEANLRDLLEELDERGTTVVVIGTWSVDARLFPKSGKAFDELDTSLRGLSGEFGQVSYMQVSDLLVPWDDYLADHCHWSSSGHAKVATAIESHVQRFRPTG